MRVQAIAARAAHGIARSRPARSDAARGPLGAASSARTNVAAKIAAAFAAAAWPAGPALTFPEGPPWDAAGDTGCTQCHFDAPPVEASSALTISGLPSTIASGARYPLTVRLADEQAARVGFLLTARHGDRPAGAFSADDERVEASGAQARSTEAGSTPVEPGIAEWRVIWQAPEENVVRVELELWANAGNDDKSPFGDTTHVRRFPLGAAQPEDGSSGSPRTME